MNNSNLKNKILSRIDNENFINIFKALTYIGCDISILEAVPLEQVNKVRQICEDYGWHT